MTSVCKIYFMFNCVGKQSPHKAVLTIMDGEIDTTATVYEYRLENSYNRCSS